MSVENVIAQIKTIQGDRALVETYASTNGPGVFLGSEAMGLPVRIPVVLCGDPEATATAIVRRLDLAWKRANGIPVKVGAFI